jgi:hypothetical protein
MDQEIADLLGFDPDPPAPVRRGPGRPRGSGRTTPMQRQAAMAARSERAAARLDQLLATRRANQEPDPEQAHMTVADALHGVSVSWLSQVFSMDPGTIKKRLKDCPPLHRRKAGFTYDLKVAAQYLVKPSFDIDAYMQTMKPSELPTHLQEQYWSAMTKRQQWEEKAGQLWRTDAVLEVLGDVFQTIKFTMQLWPDNIERLIGLTGDQRRLLVGMLDEMQKDLHGKLVDMPKAKVTRSTLQEAPVPPLPTTVDEEEYDIDDLV